MRPRGPRESSANAVSASVVVRPSRRAPRPGACGARGCEDDSRLAAVSRRDRRPPEPCSAPSHVVARGGRASRPRCGPDDEPEAGACAARPRRADERASRRRSLRAALDHDGARHRDADGDAHDRGRDAAQGPARRQRRALPGGRPRRRLPRSARLAHHEDSRARLDRRHRADRARAQARIAHVHGGRRSAREPFQPRPPDSREQPAEAAGADRRRLHHRAPRGRPAACGDDGDPGCAPHEHRARGRAGDESTADPRCADGGNDRRRALARPPVPDRRQAPRRSSSVCFSCTSSCSPSGRSGSH